MLLFVCIFILAILFAVVFKKPLKRFAWIFYVLALVLDTLALLSYTMTFPRPFQMLLLYPLQRCFFAFAFFAIVMFIGVFNNKSRIRAYFMPIRAELSILACFFALPHIVRSLNNFAPMFFTNTAPLAIPTYVSLVLALIITALMLVLGITSFKVIREKILAATWKRIQRLAYFFFLFIYVHIGLVLLPSALKGGVDALESVIVYSIIFLLYSVSRIRKALNDRSVVLEHDQNKGLEDSNLPA